MTLTPLEQAIRNVLPKYVNVKDHPLTTECFDEELSGEGADELARTIAAGLGAKYSAYYYLSEDSELYEYTYETIEDVKKVYPAHVVVAIIPLPEVHHESE